MSGKDKQCRREARGLKFSWVPTKREWVPWIGRDDAFVIGESGKLEDA